jgi:hypothetical protein
MPRASSVHALWLMSAAVGAAARPGVLRLLSPVDDHSHDGPSPTADIASWGRGAQTVSLDRTLYAKEMPGARPDVDDEPMIPAPQDAVSRAWNVYTPAYRAWPARVTNCSYLNDSRFSRPPLSLTKSGTLLVQTGVGGQIFRSTDSGARQGAIHSGVQGARLNPGASSRPACMRSGRLTYR